MKIPFTKMHGCGNDYIYVNAMLHPIADPQACAVAWSDRHRGIGSDGLVLIDSVPERLRVGKQSPAAADYAMRIFNADGSEAMMCGNAARCIGKYLYERGITDKTEIRLLTPSGVKTLCLRTVNGMVASVTVDMGEPVFDDDTLFLGDRGLAEGTFVSMGNPHYVIFTDDVDQVGETGRMLERHPAFPQRCNIEFANIVTPGSIPERGPTARSFTPAGERSGCATIRTRVWERGSGITQACGTGACATAVAACLTSRASRTSDIVMDGGTLHIEWRESDNHVYMTGPAAFIFDGEVQL